MANINEVKNDITDEDLKAFEEAEEKGEVKISERTLDEEELKETGDTKETEQEIEAESEESEEEEEESSGETTESSTVEIKEVSGETPREQALRLELTRVRKKLRESSQKGIFKESDVDNKNSDDELKELGYDDDQIKTLDKAFDIIGERKGFVRRAQTYETMANETLANFIEEHPEYSVENDKDDIYWGRFTAIQKSDYNLVGKSQKQLKSIFEKIDRDVKEELGESSSKSNFNAQKQKIESVSAGGSGTSTSKGKTENKSIKSDRIISGNHPGLKFSGFDDDELEEFIN